MTMHWDKPGLDSRPAPRPRLSNQSSRTGVVNSGAFVATNQPQSKSPPLPGPKFPLMSMKE